MSDLLGVAKLTKGDVGTSFAPVGGVSIRQCLLGIYSTDYSESSIYAISFIYGISNQNYKRLDNGNTATITDISGFGSVTFSRTSGKTYKYWRLDLAVED